MIAPLFNHLLIPYIVAMFLAMNMGGSGTGPSFSAAYGANVIRKTLIPGLFGVMVFLGAILAGKATASTIGKGLLEPDMMDYVVVTIILFSVAMALLLANLLGIPQSTSQATVMTVAAPALYFDKLNTHKLFIEIIPTWFVLPIISFILCYLVSKYIYNPMRRRGFFFRKEINQHPIIKTLIIIMSSYVAFAIGSNNVANASGPIASMTINELNIVNESRSFILILILATLIIAPSFGIGSSIFGHKIVKNTGKEILLFGPIEAIIISFITASLLLMASGFRGIPTSLVQLNVGAILGIGVAKLGYKNIFRKTQVNKFFAMWIIAPMISFGIALLLIYLADIYGMLKF